MDDTQESGNEAREALRRRWLAHAGAAFDLMFEPAYQDQLVTFEQREQRAVELGGDLTCWLLQQQVNADPQAQLAAPACCPKCGRPARSAPAGGPLAARAVTTRAGDVTLQRQRWRCTTCRVVFFPLGREAAPGHRGV